MLPSSPGNGQPETAALTPRTCEHAVLHGEGRLGGMKVANQPTLKCGGDPSLSGTPQNHRVVTQVPMTPRQADWPGLAGFEDAAGVHPDGLGREGPDAAGGQERSSPTASRGSHHEHRDCSAVTRPLDFDLRDPEIICLAAVSH